MKSTPKALVVLAAMLAAPAYAAEESGMGPMHEHMQKMQEQMAAIHAEQDSAKRADLMAEHRASMREGMQMMQRGEPEGMSMEQRMHAMEERMGMMGMMMEQMMEHHHAGEDPTAADAPAAEHQH